MASRWSTKRKVWTIAITVLVTIVLVFVATNFVRPEKSLEPTIAHRYAIDDHQFRPKQYSHDTWKDCPLREKIVERVLWPIKSQL